MPDWLMGWLIDYVMLGSSSFVGMLDKDKAASVGRRRAQY